MSEKKFEGLDEFWDHLQGLMREQGVRKVELENDLELGCPDEIEVIQSEDFPYTVSFFLLRRLCSKLGILLSRVEIRGSKGWDPVPLTGAERQMQMDQGDEKFALFGRDSVKDILETFKEMEAYRFFYTGGEFENLVFIVETEPRAWAKIEQHRIFSWLRTRIRKPVSVSKERINNDIKDTLNRLEVSYPEDEATDLASQLRDYLFAEIPSGDEEDC